MRIIHHKNNSKLELVATWTSFHIFYCESKTLKYFLKKVFSLIRLLQFVQLRKGWKWHPLLPKHYWKIET